jgi:tetratricopeptide (TPR) repeat protein
MFAGLLGVPLLLAGLFGLASAYFPGTDLLQSAYAGLQSATNALIEQGMDLPLDLSVTIEEWLGAAPMRFVVAPVGLLLLLFSAMGFPGSGGSKKSKIADDAELPGYDESLEPADRKGKKKLLKTAATMRKNGELEAAAEMLWGAREYDKAAEYYLEAELPARAAEIRHDQNRFLESAELYLKAGKHEAAGAIFAQQNEWTRAGECYVAANSLSIAAEMYEKAEDYPKAAQCFADVEFFRHAAACWVKAKQWSRAADCLRRVFVDELPKAKSDAKKLAELQKVARQVAKLFDRAGQAANGLSVLEQGQCWVDAAELALSLGRHVEAADHFRSAGDLPRSAEALRGMGESEAAARVLGEYHRDRGELKEAAVQMQEAGDWSEAGDLYRRLESFSEAGDCYVRQGDWPAAAEMFRISNDRAKAAECYEKISRFNEAAECWALDGNSVKEAELLDRAGQFLKAGQVFHREGMDDEAITVLQKVDPGHSDFPIAAALLGDIFRAHGQQSLAIKKLLQSLAGAELDRGNMPVFYILATIYESADRPDAAVEIYEKILTLDYHYKDVEERLVQARGRIQGDAPVQAAAGGTETGSAQSSSTGTPGRYQIVGELGRGGMGIVYKAQDTVLDRRVAFKVLPESFKENPQAVANFLREAKAAAKLNHPNIVTVYDTGEQDGHFYIAMEYVDGTTIKEILRRRGVISGAGILHVTAQICEALAYAHEQKVVHRDIKPANAMWTRDKKAKIMDFGLAKVVEDVRNHTTVVAGTPYYMSPEQTLGKNVDHRTDIYSLGVTMFEMATGTVPFKEGNIPYHHVHTPAPDVRSLRRDVPLAIVQIVNRCLAKDPAKRYQSVREIMNEIRGSLSGPPPGD